MLRNRVYIGQIDVPDFNVSMQCDFEPLVTERIFFRVQASLRRSLRGHSGAATERS